MTWGWLQKCHVKLDITLFRCYKLYSADSAAAYSVHNDDDNSDDDAEVSHWNDLSLVTVLKLKLKVKN